MEVIIVLLIIVGGAIWLIQQAKYKLESAKNFIMGEKGHCIDCKYCICDKSRQHSNTDYFCRLSKCQNITDQTIMDCVEKPVVTEEDLKEIFKLKIWTFDGEQYIRTSLLGQKMSFSDVNAFLSQLPKEHPEYIKK